MENKLQARLASQLIRRRLTIKEGLIDFASNDYLGFAKDPQSICCAKLGSTGSRLLTGNSKEAEELESAIAQFHGAQSALLFHTGYLANLALFSTLPLRGSTVLHDKEIHASIRDGIRLSFANSASYQHCDLNHLESLLQKARGTVFVAAEAIYSIRGTLLPLKEMAILCNHYGAHLIIDEAHAVGFYEKGLTSHLALEDHVFARMISFGKALGCSGAALLGSKLLTEMLINEARPFIYTTAPPYYVLSAISHAYTRLKDSCWQRQVLKDHCSTMHTKTPVFFRPLKRAKEASIHLEKNGFDVRALFPPTTALGEEGLRIIFHAFNTKEEITKVCALLSSLE